VRVPQDKTALFMNLEYNTSISEDMPTEFKFYAQGTRLTQGHTVFCFKRRKLSENSKKKKEKNWTDPRPWVTRILNFHLKKLGFWGILKKMVKLKETKT
jgi:hypothetical protein